MEESDMDISLSPTRKHTAKQGRRAAKQPSAFIDEDKEAFTSIKPRDLFAVNESQQEPPKTRHNGRPHRQGVWESETSFRPKTSKSKAGTYLERGDDDDEIPIIPDLDDVQEEDLVMKIADAPNVAVNKVVTYKELDNDLLNHAAFATLEDIDLRILTRCMAPEDALKEPDEEWTWDTLFADVGGQLQTEWVSRDSPIDGEQEGNIADRPFTAFNKFPV